MATRRRTATFNSTVRAMNGQVANLANNTRRKYNGRGAFGSFSSRSEYPMYGPTNDMVNRNDMWWSNKNLERFRFETSLRNMVNEKNRNTRNTDEQLKRFLEMEAKRHQNKFVEAYEAKAKAEAEAEAAAEAEARSRTPPRAINTKASASSRKAKATTAPASTRRSVRISSKFSSK